MAFLPVCEKYPHYEGLLKQGLITKDQIPTIDWDGGNDLVLLKPWITKDRGSVSSADEAWLACHNNDEGAPPVWIERLIAPVFCRLGLRNSDRIRQLVRRQWKSLALAPRQRWDDSNAGYLSCAAVSGFGR
jgi:hypothetical protein